MILVDSALHKNPFGEIFTCSETKFGFGTATYSRCGKYRYRLSRVWDTSLPRVNFIMLNPSKANERTLDPTVTRCANFAKNWGYGSFEVTNIFPLISTNPKSLKTDLNVLTTDADNAILQAVIDADKSVCAWGAHGKIEKRGDFVKNMLIGTGKKFYCFKVLVDGNPTHPLYLPYTQKLIKYLN